MSLTSSTTGSCKCGDGHLKICHIKVTTIASGAGGNGDGNGCSGTSIAATGTGFGQSDFIPTALYGVAAEKQKQMREQELRAKEKARLVTQLADMMRYDRNTYIYIYIFRTQRNLLHAKAGGDEEGWAAAQERQRREFELARRNSAKARLRKVLLVEVAVDFLYCVCYWCSCPTSASACARRVC